MISLDIRPTQASMEITARGHVLRFSDGRDEVRILFDGPSRQMVDVLDALAAAALEIRSRLLRELATDEDA